MKFDFVLGKRSFNGIIDEVRLRDRYIIIRDYKTEKPYLKEGSMKLSGNPQLTLYCAGLEALCLADDEIAEKLGMIEEREIFRKNNFYISPKLKPELFMVSALSEKFQESENPPKIIHTTERSERDFRELMRFVEDSEREIKYYTGKKEIPPTERSRKCDFCDVRISCVKRLEEELSPDNELEDKNGQMHFLFLGKYSHKHFAGNKSRQRKFNWKR